ncbi:unnamed protein product [Blepharisma stoltei]|uniref:Protein-tyrosine-phosphatase n=1 Tax=Blepharisma stoltei TaxID=1481888 RepID=A0AAU9K2Z7_9CILI|nr:unnamed protein product [Blepharisma stoltei]
MYSFSKVTNYLYLGDYNAATNLVLLQHHKITHILTVGDGMTPCNPEQFQWKSINIADLSSCDISQHFDECNDFIDKANREKGRVLVHCSNGVSRAPTITIAYLMYKKPCGFTQAFEFVKAKHPDTAPNSGFSAQLRQYQTSMNKSSKHDLTTGDACNCKLF